MDFLSWPATSPYVYDKRDEDSLRNTRLLYLLRAHAVLEKLPVLVLLTRWLCYPHRHVWLSTQPTSPPAVLEHTPFKALFAMQRRNIHTLTDDVKTLLPKEWSAQIRGLLQRWNEWHRNFGWSHTIWTKAKAVQLFSWDWSQLAATVTWKEWLRIVWLPQNEYEYRWQLPPRISVLPKDLSTLPWQQLVVDLSGKPPRCLCSKMMVDICLSRHIWPQNFLWIVLTYEVSQWDIVALWRWILAQPYYSEPWPHLPRHLPLASLHDQWSFFCLAQPLERFLALRCTTRAGGWHAISTYYTGKPIRPTPGTQVVVVATEHEVVATAPVWHLVRGPDVVVVAAADYDGGAPVWAYHHGALVRCPTEAFLRGVLACW